MKLFTRTQIEYISKDNKAYHNKNFRGKYICQLFDDKRNITLLVANTLEDMYEQLKEYGL